MLYYCSLRNKELCSHVWGTNLWLFFAFEHSETVHLSLPPTTEMQNIENPWAQNSSTDSVLCYEERQPSSLPFPKHTQHSVSMISKHPALQKSAAERRHVERRGSLHCDSKHPPCWSVLEEEGLRKLKCIKQTHGVTALSHSSPHLLCCYSEFTKASQRSHVIHITAGSWPLQTLSSSYTDSVIRCLTLSFIEHLVLRSAVLPSWFLKKRSIFHTTCSCTISTSNLVY